MDNIKTADPALRSKKDLQGTYILATMQEHFLNGDTYIMSDELYGICKDMGKGISYDVFRMDVRHLLQTGKLYQEGQRIYAYGTWAFEEDASKHIAAVLKDNTLAPPCIPEQVEVNGINLDKVQREAVVMALSHRLSIVLGGAGCGKTTLISAIVQYGRQGVLVCAPTGKATQNLRERIRVPARTVHSVLGKGYEENEVPWPHTKLPHIGTVIIDEASMLTIGLLDGILNRVAEDCCVVLVGDPKQLPSVGSGNVIPDLIELGLPHTCLHTNHRQSKDSTALYHNVVNFDGITLPWQLAQDESFSIRDVDTPEQMLAEVTNRAVLMLREAKDFQVLAAHNSMVDRLNHYIQNAWNPLRPGMQTIRYNGKELRNGDRVIITKNDSRRNCWNGDIGQLAIRVGSETTDEPGCFQYSVALNDGRSPAWLGAEALEYLELAYAITIHKAQGSQFDDVLLPMTMSKMLSRSLFYTAASRARRSITIYDCESAVRVSLQTQAKPRRSTLVQRTQLILS